MLCLDVGNSHIYGGIYQEDAWLLRFRCTSKTATSDELGIFLKNVLRENAYDASQITAIAVASVVPSCDYSLRAACIKYFDIDPFFLQPGIKTGLRIEYKNPNEVGADRIANAIAVTELFPKHNVIVLDFGTATTLCAITDKKHYLGGSILPGVRLSSEALAKNTAKLPTVDIVKMQQPIGRSTIESIQSGLFFGNIGACRELITHIQKEAFQNAPVTIIATGGFAHLFEDANLYHHLLPDLVLDGIRLAYTYNHA